MPWRSRVNLGLLVFIGLPHLINEHKEAAHTDTRGSMKTGSTLVGTILLCLLGSTLLHGQTAAQEKPLLAEQVFKNVQVLRGVSVNEFMETMGFFAASLNANCTTCHGQDSGGSWEGYASDNIPQKQTARRMILMMNMINQTYFAGRQVLTCYSCHRFGRTPEIVPDLTVQYGDAPEKDPVEITAQAAGRPTPDQVLD